MYKFLATVFVLVGFVFLAVSGAVSAANSVKSSVAMHASIDRAAQIERAINQ